MNTSDFSPQPPIRAAILGASGYIGGEYCDCSSATRA